MAADYSYIKSTVDPDSLRLEILAESNITTEFESVIFNSPDDLALRFTSTLTPTEESYLDAVVSGHLGIEEYLPPSLVFISDGTGAGYFVTIDSTLSGSSLSEYIDERLYFINLNDVPSTYSGSGYLYPRVSSTASGLEFAPADATYIKGTAVDETDITEGYILRYDAVDDHLHYENIGNIIEEFGIFGSSVSVAVDEPVSSTTSIIFQEKLTTTISGLSYGSYRIGWYYQWQIANSNFKFLGQIQIDDVDTIMEHEERPSDASSWTAQSGFYYLTTSGTIQLDLDFASESNGKLCSIRNARIEFWRVE